jgi:flavin-dependent dehydrogenase
MTHPPLHIDIAVIGGGPAGAAAGRFLALWGLDVAILARSAPRRSLAESLPPSCASLFEQLGLRGEIDAAGFVRATGNTVHWGGATGRVERFGGGVVGYQVERNTFDALVRRSAAAAGARVIGDATVGTVERTDGRNAFDGSVATDDAGHAWTIGYDADGESRELRAKWLLDCTGRAGLVARQGFRRPEPGVRTMALVGIWERDESWNVADESHTLVESYDGGWAWSVPVSAARRYVTVMVDPALTPLPNRQQLAAAYHAELARTEVLHSLVAGAQLLGTPWACDASGYSADRFAAPRLMLVGDAGSFVDPLSSFGVKKALASAWLAAVVANTALADTAMEAEALGFFESRERAMYEHLRGQTAALSREAQTGHASDFWRGRSDVEPADTDGALDVVALRTDPRVLAAFEEIKRRPAVKLSLAPAARVVQRPTVQGNRVVLEDHLATPAITGVRYLRSIDLMLLSRLARDCDQVPDLFHAYNRAAPPAPLPDFLGALSVLVGLEMLALA